MLDIQLLRNDINNISKILKTKGYDLDINNFNYLENLRKTLQVNLQDLNSKRNSLSKQIGVLKKENKDATSLMKEVVIIGKNIDKIEEEFLQINKNLNSFILDIPNLPNKNVPIGKNETDNVEILKSGIPKFFNFPISDHFEIGAKFGLDLETSSLLSGSRFCFLKGEIAKLHRVLSQFMLDIHTQKHGYVECYTPYIVNPEILIGTGQLPKFEQDMYKVFCGDSKKEQFLISTSEITLTNSVREKILKESDLPIKLTSHTPCFRAEAGSYGKDTKGLIRMHQFDKIEMVQIVHPDKSYEVLEEMLNHAKKILELLDLPFRIITLCTKDIGFSASKTYDIEVWMPSQNTYREISSCSNCEDFQARRMKARFKDKNGKIKYVHTLNGSGLAVGRTLAAIIENYQDENKNIIIPKILQPYFNGKTIIS